MKRLFVSLLLAAACCYFTYAQEPANDLLQAGIALHDAGKYEEAIARYDEALKLNPKLVTALYEKAYSLTSLRKNAEALEITKQIIRDYPDYDNMAHVYMVAGNALDDLKRSEEALTIYNEGIKHFPQFHLFYYNKGLSLARLGRADEAKEQVRKDLLLKPVHPSGHRFLALYYEDEQNLVPAIFAHSVFLLLESKGSRAEAAFAALQKLLKGNAQADSTGKNVNITLFMPKDSKTQEDDFSIPNLSLSFASASGFTKVLDSLGKRTDMDKMKSSMDMIIEASGNEKKKKGFAWKFYVPFFVEMKNRNYVEIFCYLTLRIANNQTNNDWMAAHEKETTAFYDWMGSYTWPKKVD